MQEHDGFARVVERFGLTPSQASYLSQLTAQDSTASFGERAAKNWEERLKIEDARLLNAGRPAATPASAIPYNATKVREIPVVGKGSGGLMPERLWTDGDYPVGSTDACAEIATADPHAFLIGVDGFSMVPRYNPSEYALVEPGTHPELEDDVLVRLASGQTMLKRLLSKRDGWKFGSYNEATVLFYEPHEVTWVYYVAHPVPRRKIKTRC